MRSIVQALAAAAAVTCTALPALAEDAAKKPIISCAGNEENLNTYLQIHKVLFSDRDTSRVEEFYAPVIISHNLDSGGGSASEVKSSDMVAMWERSKAEDPERILADDLILCSGDFVIVRTTIHNADNTGIGPYPPTGKPYSISATDIYRFQDGRVVERWGNADLVSMFNQIGYTFVPKADAPKPE